MSKIPVGSHQVCLSALGNQLCRERQFFLLKMTQRIVLLVTALSFVSGLPGCSRNDASNGMVPSDTVVLANGVRIDGSWPPRYDIPDGSWRMPVPYLETPPRVIPITVGRQLLVDDFLIEDTNLTRRFHYPEPHRDNPVLESSASWESSTSGGDFAAPFSDGIWFDEEDDTYKMWYAALGGPNNRGPKGNLTAYATSADGVVWEKHVLDVVPGTNLLDRINRDSASYIIDKREPDRAKRYKAFRTERNADGSQWIAVLRYSADGIHWSDAIARSGEIGNRSTVFFNPYLGKWTYSLREDLDYDTNRRRQRRFVDADTPELLIESLGSSDGETTTQDQSRFWFREWPDEPRHPEFPDIQPAIYNHDAIAYESLLLGFFSVWQGPENDVTERLGIPKRNEIVLGYSRDGYHWDRPDMNRFIGVDDADSAWNQGNVQSVIGAPLIVGDELFFYASGRQGQGASWDAAASTGLFVLRRDGFASVEADSKGGWMITRTLETSGEHMFVNVDADAGRLQVELLDEYGEIVPGYSRADSVPIASDSTRHPVRWKKNKPMVDAPTRLKLRFYLESASLYSFWISEHESGESNGYTAGGGPGLNAAGVDRPESGEN